MTDTQNIILFEEKNYDKKISCLSNEIIKFEVDIHVLIKNGFIIQTENYVTTSEKSENLKFTNFKHENNVLSFDLLPKTEKNKETFYFKVSFSNDVFVNYKIKVLNKIED